MLSGHGIYTPLASNPHFYDRLKRVFLNVTLCFSLSSALLVLFLGKSVFEEEVITQLKRAIYTHLGLCSLDWLLACDNTSSKPSEHKNLMVHAASVTLSHRARQRREMDEFKTV